MPDRRYPHIFLSGPNRSISFRNPRRGSSTSRFPNRDRSQHSEYLYQQLMNAWSENDRRHAVAQTSRFGVYLEFFSEPGFDLAIRSLENLGSGIRLMNVRQDPVQGGEQTKATVFVPNSQRGYFLNKIRAYVEENDKRSGKPKNSNLINSISGIRLALLESFWIDSGDLLPNEAATWVEVWLSSDNDEIIQRFKNLIARERIECAEGFLKFPERAVLAILVSRAQLELLIEISDDIAEFRLVKEVASFYLEMNPQEQVERLNQLLARTNIDLNEDVAVLILDSGVNNGHALLQPVLDNADLFTYDDSWGTQDDLGHGTLMAGGAVFGDLLAQLNAAIPVTINHRLESTKILPPHSMQNPKELWGYVTSQGVSRAEIQSPRRKRIICLAVTSIDNRERGRPSSWSALIDELSSGYSDDRQRLFVISAGNIYDQNEFRNYPDSNITNEIHDPGQSWNALTIGAFTEKVRITNSSLQGFTPIAPFGGLSPHSTTSVAWDKRKWPLKPDVVFEGGNVAKGPNDSIFSTEDLKLLSTYYDPQVAQFAHFDGTSAATAQAAWMAAVIQSRYPEIWPETIRALIVHSAEWTDAMRNQFLSSQPNKAEYARLLRICGYGVPDINRALYCASNTLTLISQSYLQPFDEQGGQRFTKEMHFYKLPWPLDVLRDLGETRVRMRVTLSYFVEPGPGEVGWQDRYRYASHTLRFAVNGPNETENDFISRINNLARDDGNNPTTEGPRDRWIMGENARNVGSIHSDIWEGMAADLALSNLIGVYPGVGWWRERHNIGRVNRRTRYALLISILTPLLGVDIYTPVAIQLRIKVPIEIPVR